MQQLIGETTMSALSQFFAMPHPLSQSQLNQHEENRMHMIIPPDNERL